MNTRGAARWAPLVFASLILGLVPGFAPAAGAEADKDRILPGCGICYPGGYDSNTVGDVVGRVSEIVVPDDGPVRFALTGDEDRWTVLASPAWFWKMASPSLAAGDTITVHGSKSLGADGKLYIIAQTISRPDGTPAVLLRDGRGVPLWRGSHGGMEMRGGGHGSGRSPISGHGRNGDGSGRR